MPRTKPERQRAQDQVADTILTGTKGLYAADVINGCITAINTITLATQDAEFCASVAEGLRQLADHITGECDCDEPVPPGDEPPPGVTRH